MKQYDCEPLKLEWRKMEKPKKELFEKALEQSLEVVRKNLSIYQETFLSEAGTNNQYDLSDNTLWTNGFCTGMVWAGYALTKDEVFLEVGKKHTLFFKERLEKDIVMQHHDIGFLYSLSTVADYKLTGDELAKDISLQSAYRLAGLYRPTPGVIQRGGDMSNDEDPFTGVFIIDCLLNVPLLYWAARENGDDSLFEMGYKHVQNAVEALVQQSGASFQKGKGDILTGELTCFPDDSQGKGGVDACWSRGQAWVMYGLPLTYDYTKDERMLEINKSVTNYFLNRLPEDYVANWDLYYTENEVVRDSSAAAIAVCGILEFAKHLPLCDEYRETLEMAALKILESLTRNYLIPLEENRNAILRSGTYAYNINRGVNEPCIWGDYFYIEALWRVLETYNRFW